MPTTLRGLIAARIDRLPAAAKATLQRASVVGRFLNYRALRALHEGDGELDRSLAHLLRAELIREWAHVPEREYLFKHALTQEAAYASILLRPAARTPSAAGALSRAGSDSRCGSGGAARSSLVEGRGLGEGPDLFA